MHVFMCVSMSRCVLACVCACMCVCVCAGVRACMCACVHLYVCVCVGGGGLHVHICVHASMATCVCAHEHMACLRVFNQTSRHDPRKQECHVPLQHLPTFSRLSLGTLMWKE